MLEEMWWGTAAAGAGSEAGLARRLRVRVMACVWLDAAKKQAPSILPANLRSTRFDQPPAMVPGRRGQGSRAETGIAKDRVELFQALHSNVPVCLPCTPGRDGRWWIADCALAQVETHVPCGPPASQFLLIDRPCEMVHRNKWQARLSGAEDDAGTCALEASSQGFYPLLLAIINPLEHLRTPKGPKVNTVFASEC